MTTFKEAQRSRSKPVARSSVSRKFGKTVSKGEGYTKDCEKYSAAAVNGWFVIRGTTAQIKEGLVIQWIEKLIERLRGG